MMAESQSSLSKSCNRLDKYHLLNKEWLDHVQCKVDKKDYDAKLILKVLKDKLSRLFDYVETSTELKYSINDYKCYYNANKKQLKSEQVLTSIENFFHSICNNFNLLHIATLLMFARLILREIALLRQLIVVSNAAVYLLIHQ